MRQILFLFIITLSVLSCKAQNPVVSLDAYRHRTPDGAYFKDLNNELDKYTGTWVYSDGVSTLTIILQKKEQIPINNDYRDILVGEYEFVNNGNTIINTIPELTSNASDIKNRNIGGSQILQNPNRYVTCDDCLPNERRVKLYFADPDRDYLSTAIVLRYDLSSTIPERITATIVATDGVILPYEGAPQVICVPYGEYLMEKQ